MSSGGRAKSKSAVCMLIPRFIRQNPEELKRFFGFADIRFGSEFGNQMSPFVTFGRLNVGKKFGDSFLYIIGDGLLREGGWFCPQTDNQRVPKGTKGYQRVPQG